nr:hypothetical protein [Planctomycetota bacterium]
MTDTDPLLRAVADGDPACPDGRALARLGALVRDHARPPAPIDVAAAVRARMRGEAAFADDDSDQSAEDIERAQIDRAYDGDGSTDEHLARLGDLVRSAADLPRPVDLIERVRAKLRQSANQPSMPTLDGGSRWRIWSAVIASHVAALVVVA